MYSVLKKPVTEEVKTEEKVNNERFRIGYNILMKENKEDWDNNLYSYDLFKTVLFIYMIFTLYFLNSFDLSFEISSSIII